MAAPSRFRGARRLRAVAVALGLCRRGRRAAGAARAPGAGAGDQPAAAALRLDAGGRAPTPGAGPSLDQRVDWEFVHRGLPLEITAEYGQWRRVRDADGAGGWVHTRCSRGCARRWCGATAPVPLRAGPTDGARGAGDGRAGRGRRGSRPAAAPGARSTPSGVEGWLPRAALWGVGPDETDRVGFGARSFQKKVRLRGGGPGQGGRSVVQRPKLRNGMFLSRWSPPVVAAK